MEEIYEYQIYLKNGEKFIVNLTGLSMSEKDGVILSIYWEAPEDTKQDTYTVLEYINPREIVAITRR